MKYVLCIFLIFLFSCASSPRIEIGDFYETDSSQLEFQGNPYVSHKRKINAITRELKITKIDYPSAAEVVDSQFTRPFINYLEEVVKEVLPNGEKIFVDYAVVFSAMSLESFTKYRTTGQGVLIDVVVNEIAKSKAKNNFMFEKDSLVCRVKGRYKGERIEIDESEPYQSKVVKFSSNENSLYRESARKVVEKCGAMLKLKIGEIAASPDISPVH